MWRKQHHLQPEPVEGVADEVAEDVGRAAQPQRHRRLQQLHQRMLTPLPQLQPLHAAQAVDVAVVDAVEMLQRQALHPQLQQTVLRRRLFPRRQQADAVAEVAVALLRQLPWKSCRRLLKVPLRRRC